MNIHSPSKNVQVKNSILVDITAAAVNGTAVSVLGFTRAMAVFTSAPSGVGTTSTLQLQEAPDNGSGAPGAFVNVANGTFATATTAGGQWNQVMDVDLSKRQPWLRPVHTGVGGAAAGPVCGNFHLFNAQHLPPAQDQAILSV